MSKYFHKRFVNSAASPNHRALLWVVSMIMLATTAHAQQSDPDTITIGLGGGLEYGEALVNLGNVPGYSTFYRGALSGLNVHLAVTNPTLFGASFGASLRLGALLSNVSFRETLPETLVLLPGQLTPVPSSIEQELTFSMQAFQLELLPQLRLGDLTIAAGPYIGYRLFFNPRNVSNLTQPAGARFVNPGGFPTENDGRTIIWDDGSLLQDQPISLGGLLAASYSIAFNDRLALVPELRLRADLSSPIGNGQWLAYSAGGGVSLTYKIPMDESKAPYAWTPPPPSLKASVDLFSTGEDGARIQKGIVRIGELLRRQRLWLPPVIWFDRDSSGLPTPYVRLSPEEASRFSLDSIARLDPYRAQSHLLNVVGTRLHSDRRMRVRLVASAAPGEAAGIASARAKAIRSYLLNIWRCNPAQLEVARESQADATDDAAGSSVRIVADHDDPITALEGEWSERYFRAPPIGMEPGINVTGIKRWSLTFLQNGKLLARQTSEDAGGDRLNLDMLLHDLDTASPPAPLAAEFLVEDSTGKIASGHDELPFEYGHGSEGQGVRSVSTYYLFGSSGQSGAHGERLREIAAAIPDGAHVTVSSMTREGIADAEDVARLLHGLLATKGAVRIEVDEKGQPRSDASGEKLIGRGIAVVVESSQGI